MSVVNVKKGQPYNTYIGRENRYYNHKASPWANPYVMDEWHTREGVLGLYYWHLIAHPELYHGTLMLRDQALGCYCAPLPCHGDLLTWLSRGDALPDITIPHAWQECQFCGAPFIFWKSPDGPAHVYREGQNRDVLFDPSLYMHINGWRTDSRQMVGCLTCGKVGLYALGPAQLRVGVLSLYADEVLKREAVLQGKIAPFKANTRR